jgi:xylulokinase
MSEASPTPAERRYVLAVDHGTSGVKTALMTLRGERVASAEERTPLLFLPDGGVEQDAGLWFGALVRTCRELVGRRLVPAEAILALSVSSTFSSTVAVGPDGQPLANALTWMDARGAPYVRRAMRGFPSIQGYGLRKVLSWIRRTGGGPSLSGKDDIAHLLLLRHEQPEVYRRARWFMGSKDYLNLRLTGQAAASHDSMTLFWVTNTRDPNHIHYDPILLRRLAIDAERLPPLRRSIDLLGTLRPEVATEIGLGPQVQVVVGSPDHQCAGVGSGAVRDFEGHLYVGTSSWIQCVVPFKKTDMFHSIASLPTAIPGKYYSANEQDLAGGCLPFLLDRLIFAADGLGTTPAPQDALQRLDALAATVPAGSGGLLFAPWLNGERTPVDDHRLRGALLNLSLGTPRAAVVRAVLEGVALNTRWALFWVERFAGRRLDPLTAVGGGAKSEIWCQIFADVLCRTVRQVEDPEWTNARGAAFLAAIGLGKLCFADLPGLVKVRREFQPDPGHRDLYDRRYRELVGFYRRNRAMFHRLNPER